MKTQIFAPTPENISALATQIQRGELVAFPTETVYGLGANAFDPLAVTKVFETKARPQFDPLIVHIAPALRTSNSKPYHHASLHLIQLQLLNADVADTPLAHKLDKLAQHFWPGPLTLVVPRGPAVLDLVTSGLSGVAIRMPQHEVALRLIEAAGVPLVGPSANRFGRISPTTANDVQHELGGRISSILDGGRCAIGVESTVLLLTESDMVCLRPGGISIETIEAAMDEKVKFMNKNSEGSPLAPGQLKSHYAPEKRVHLLPRSVTAMGAHEWQELKSKLPEGEMIGCLIFQGDPHEASRQISHALGKKCVIKVLSPSGSMHEAAHLFFGSLRVLDLAPVSVILAEPVPSSMGLGRAIQDRLEKAAGPRATDHV